MLTCDVCTVSCPAAPTTTSYSAVRENMKPLTLAILICNYCEAMTAFNSSASFSLQNDMAQLNQVITECPTAQSLQKHMPYTQFPSIKHSTCQIRYSPSWPFGELLPFRLCQGLAFCFSFLQCLDTESCTSRCFTSRFCALRYPSHPATQNSLVLLHTAVASSGWRAAASRQLRLCSQQLLWRMHLLKRGQGSSSCHHQACAQNNSLIIPCNIRQE